MATSSQAALWDRLAGSYDRIVRPFRKAYRHAAALLGEDLAGCESVLELAAGTGQLTLAIAAAATEVTTTDRSPAMLRRLEERLQAHGVTGVTVQCEDASALSFDDGVFDAVVGANLLHVVPDPERVLGEIHRVLRPDGRLIVPTFCHGETVSARLISGALSLVSSFRAHTRFTTEMLRERVSGNGFTVTRTERLGGLIPMVYVSGRRA